MGKKRKEVDDGGRISEKAAARCCVFLSWSFHLGQTKVEAKVIGRQKGYDAVLSVGKENLAQERFSKAKYALCFLFDQIEHFSDQWSRSRPMAKVRVTTGKGLLVRP